ncbi:MAG: hypothetical protein ACR2HX_16165 [Pyrinomonadaceae bacterium]
MKEDLVFCRILFVFELAVGAATGGQAHVPNIRAKRGVIGEADVIPTRCYDIGGFQIVVIAKDERVHRFAPGVVNAPTLNVFENVHLADSY